MISRLWVLLEEMNRTPGGEHKLVAELVYAELTGIWSLITLPLSEIEGMPR